MKFFVFRVEWGECGRSPECSGGVGGWPAVQQCADTCLLDRQQQARELARIHLESQQQQQQQQSQLQLQYSSHSSPPPALQLTLATVLSATVLSAVIQFLVRL